MTSDPPAILLVPQRPPPGRSRRAASRDRHRPAGPAGVHPGRRRARSVEARRRLTLVAAPQPRRAAAVAEADKAPTCMLRRGDSCHHHLGHRGQNRSHRRLYRRPRRSVGPHDRTKRRPRRSASTAPNCTACAPLRCSTPTPSAPRPAAPTASTPPSPTPASRSAARNRPPAAPQPPRRRPAARPTALEAWELLPTKPDWAARAARDLDPRRGRRHAARRGFLQHGLAGYAAARDRPAEDGTSMLSPHLHFGEISRRADSGTWPTASPPARAARPSSANCCGGNSAPTCCGTTLACPTRR